MLEFSLFFILHQKAFNATSPLAQWLRIRLPMQGMRVRDLVREDHTCRKATNPTTTEACVPLAEQLSLCAATTEACAPRAHAPQREKPPQWEVCAPQQSPNAAKNK